jgi:hypothetical protein
MKLNIRIAVAALMACTFLIVAAVAWAGETLTVHAGFTPDKLGGATNLSATAVFHSTTAGPQSPAVQLTAYGPAGMSVDTRGVSTCTATPEALQEAGPSACPASSRVGFGSGIGLTELANQDVPEHFTLEFFLAPSEHGHLAMLIYVDSFAPASDQKALVAHEVRGSKPYGIGITFEVPASPSLPGATLGWEEHVSLTLGASNAAYYKTTHGRRKLIHVKGIVLPKTCPRGGFPIEAMVSYADGTTGIAKTTTPCPR